MLRWPSASLPQVGVALAFRSTSVPCQVGVAPALRSTSVPCQVGVAPVALLHLSALPGRCRSRGLPLHLSASPGRCLFSRLPLHLNALPGRCRSSSLPLHLNALPGRCRSSTFRSTDTYGVTPVAFRSTFGARSSLPLLLKVSLRDSYAPPGVWSSHHSSQGVAPGLLRSTPYISPSTVPIEQRDNPGWEIRLQAEFSRYDSRGGRNPRKKRG